MTDVNKGVNPLHFGSILAIQESGSNLESLIGAVNCWRMQSEYYLVFSSEKGGGTRFSPCLSLCLSVCLLPRLLKNACMDLDEMLCVDRCWDIDELIITFELDPDYK